MRKAFVVRIFGNQHRAVRVKVRPYETDKRGVRLLACCRGLLESTLLKDYEDLKHSHLLVLGSVGSASNSPR